MPHEIENMFSVRETPWHGLGATVQEAPTAASAIRLAGLDWSVRTEPLAIAGDGRPVQARAVVRDSDGSILGHHVGASWTPLQNRDAFSWFDPFIQSGDCAFETAGSLQGGRRVWVLARINRDAAEIGPGDEVRQYLLLSNSHDASLAVRVGFTPIRVVCANTLAVAHSHSASALLRVRHTRGVVDVLTRTREIIDAVAGEFAATAEQYRYLASRGVNRADLRKYVRRVLGLTETEGKGQLCKRSADTEAAVLERFDSGYGANLPSARSTWWGGYNALTEYLSYARGRSADNRLNSLWFGDAARINRDALAAALQMAA
jgi:phage/plasmid-like protein (TIGR03299 family)